LPQDDGISLNSTVEFQLNNVEINKSEILTAQEIDVLLKQYIGHMVTLSDLNKLLNKINALYKSKGYLAAKAVLPPQKIKKGSVQIRLIEGKIGAIDIEGNNSTNSDFITDSLALSSGDLVELKGLKKNLEKLNLVNDIQVGIALKPGRKTGETDYLLTVQEPKRQQAFVYTDNAGTKDVGLYRYGFNYVDRSLSGKRDLLTVGGYVARGTRAFYTSYKRPINRLGTSLAVSGNVSTIEIVDGPIEPLAITGDSYNLGLELAHPVYAANNQLITALFGLNKKKSSTDSANVTLFKTHINSWSAGIKRQAFSSDSVSYASVRGTLAPTNWKNETSFFKINADFSYNKKLNDDWLALFRLGGQWSDTKLLPSAEQFQLGGIYTVRGYVEGLLIGDKGYYSSVELSHSVPKELKNLLGNAARYSVFLDHGAAIPFKGNGKNTNKDDYLTSLGLSVSAYLSKSISATVTAAKPLFHRRDKKDSGRINFNIQAYF